MKTKIFAVIALMGVISLGAVSLAGAQATSTTATSTATSSDSGHGKPIKLPANKVEIGPSGEAHLTGSILAISGNAISLKTWGGTWIVNVATDTVIAGAAAKGDISQIQSGDVITVHGKMSSDTGLTLRAKEIKDFSLSKKNPKLEIKKEVKGDDRDNEKEADKDIQKIIKNKNFWEKLREFFKNSTSSRN